jgi:hypothetical protein
MAGIGGTVIDGSPSSGGTGGVGGTTWLDARARDVPSVIDLSMDRIALDLSPKDVPVLAEAGQVLGGDAGSAVDAGSTISPVDAATVPGADAGTVPVGKKDGGCSCSMGRGAETTPAFLGWGLVFLCCAGRLRWRRARR